MIYKTFFLITFIIFIKIASCYHYRGGSISSRFINSNLTEVTISFGWRLSGYYCDKKTINGHRLIGPFNDYLYYGGLPITTVETYCESFSVEDDWSFGKRKFFVQPLDNSLTLTYEGCCWLSSTGHDSNWQITMNISTDQVSYSSPFAIMFPLSKL
jgi:hypothetical protein